MSRSKWAEFLDRKYLEYLRAKAAEWDKATRIMYAGGQIGNVIGGFTVGVIGAAVAGAYVVAPTVDYLAEHGLFSFGKMLAKTWVASKVAGALTSSGGPDGGFGSVASIVGGFAVPLPIGESKSVQNILNEQRMARPEYLRAPQAVNPQTLVEPPATLPELASTGNAPISSGTKPAVLVAPDSPLTSGGFTGNRIASDSMGAAGADIVQSEAVQRVQLVERMRSYISPSAQDLDSALLQRDVSVLERL